MNTTLIKAIILFCFIIIAGCNERPSPILNLAHPVATKRVVPSSGELRVWLQGQVGAVGSSGLGALGMARLNDYRVSVKIPDGAQAQLVKGQSVRVVLPIIHASQTQASVESVKNDEVVLLLSKQLQELYAQSVRVEIPLKPTGVFRVPFNAVYSPRGNTKAVFVLKNQRVESRPLKLVGLAGPSEVWITSQLAANEEVVVEGLDNLLSGDEVNVVNAAKPGEELK